MSCIIFLYVCNLNSLSMRNILDMNIDIYFHIVMSMTCDLKLMHVVTKSIDYFFKKNIIKCCVFKIQ